MCSLKHMIKHVLMKKSQGAGGCHQTGVLACFHSWIGFKVMKDDFAFLIT